MFGLFQSWVIVSVRLPDGDLEVVPLEDGVDLTGMGDVALHHVVQLKQPVEPSEKNSGRQRGVTLTGQKVGKVGKAFPTA